VPQATFTHDSRRLHLLPFFGDPILWDFSDGQVVDSARWRILKMEPFAVTMDGQRFVTRPSKGELQVYDSATGEPLTAALKVEGEIAQWGVRFSPDGGRLLNGVGESAQVWVLPKDHRPSEELVALGQLLAGRRIDPAGNLVQWPSSAARDAWAKLRAEQGGGFDRDPLEVRAWRERLVKSSERNERWFTALFHLERMVKEDPSDESLRMRRARVRTRAAMDELR
jgi:hypothetical protein